MIKEIREYFKYIDIQPLTYDESLKEAYSTGSVTGGMLRGKWVMITGATGGIGRAMSRRFCSEGCNILLCGRNREKIIQELSDLQQMYPASRFEIIKMDLSEQESIEKAVISLDVIPDILISNAGVFTEVDIRRKLNIQEKDFNDVWRVNYKGTVLLIEKMVERMSFNKHSGVVINIASICADSRKTQYTPYGMTKASLKKYSEIMQLKYSNLQFNAILPGSTATKMIDAEAGDITKETNSLYRLVLPEEIAALAAFLASGIGKYIIGGITASACEVL